MKHQPSRPGTEGTESDSPIYLVLDFNEAHSSNTADEEISMDEFEEIDKISQMVSDIPDEETPVFLTCT